MRPTRPSVWVLGDQLDRHRGALRHRSPGDCRVLLVESAATVAGRPWHRQRLHLVLSAMAHFAAELREEGFEVDHRRAATLAEGLVAHRAEYAVTRVVATEALSHAGVRLLERLGVTQERDDHFLCHRDDFARWARGRDRLLMEDFYRHQRARLALLIDGDQPVGGRWNLDHDNREPPPRDGRAWPSITRFNPDAIDREVAARLPDTWGDPADGIWPVTRAQALVRLDEFIREGLASFGPHEDAMLSGEWKLAHSTLSSSLNLGLLRPGEVAAAAERAYRVGGVPLNSVEGFIRQVIGWREYVWGVYWLWGPAYREHNALGARRPLPPALLGGSATQMACLAGALEGVRRRAYAHHIERLMVLGNLALLAGIEPKALNDWMRAGFIDGADWVMLPNVIGMALHADGGMMATKPYAAGGAYINRMSDHCGGCPYDPRRRTGDHACPFTTLYWDFLERNQEHLGSSHRMARQFAGLRRLSDRGGVRERAGQVLAMLDEGLL